MQVRLTWHAFTYHSGCKVLHITPPRVILAIIFLFNVINSNSQTVTINRKNVSLESIFFDITKQTGYNFFYDDVAMQRGEKFVSISINSATVTEALAICARVRPFEYTINGRNITVILKERSAPNEAVATPSLLNGTITDPNGLPLPGSTIRIKGSPSGVTANGNGKFELPFFNPGIVLEISHVGFETRVLKLNGEQNIVVSLQEALKTLDEVITNGYRTTTKRDNLGSSTKITADEISIQPVNNPLAALQARVPGMIVTQRGGIPGAPFIVQIRGQRSIGTTPGGKRPINSPLFVIDGVPFLSSSELMSQRSRVVANSPFSTINPADIESIEILRDANACSIYGSMGANGVVLITTKKGKTGKTSIDANIYAGIEQITRAPDFMNTSQYLNIRKEAFRNDGELPDPSNAYDLLLWDTTRYTDWKKLLIGGTAFVSNVDVHLSGGSKQTHFILGLGHNKESTVFPSDDGKTLTSASLNLHHATVNNKFETSVAFSYGIDKSDLPGRDPSDAIKTPPNAPAPYNALGKLNFSENGYPFSNPVAYLSQPYQFIQERFTVNGNFKYRICPWLTINMNTGYTLISGDEKLQIPIASQDSLLSPTGSASFAASKVRSWIAEPQLQYHDTIGRIVLRALAGTSWRSRTAIMDVQDGFGYTSDVFINSIANAAIVTTFHDFSQYRVISAYGLVGIGWDRKYLLEATIRRDGSSRFGPDKRFANFASVAGGWIFSDENFMNQFYPTISFGKLKISYGTTGNDEIDDYQFYDSWGTIRPYQVPSLVPLQLGNAEYHWETQRSFDAGIELGLFNNRIMLNAVWDQSRTTDQIIAYTLPAQTGFSTVFKNFPAVVQNRNVELVLETINMRKKDFNWSSSINLSFQQNTLLKFPGLEQSLYGQNKFVIGKPLNLYWGYRTDGVDPTEGIYRILNQKGDVIDIPNTLPGEEDKVALGTLDPKYFGGFQNSFTYKNWQLQFLFQFVGQKGQHYIYSNQTTPGYAVNQPQGILQRWQKPGDLSIYQRITQSVGSPADLAAQAVFTSDLSLTDASFIRLKNISIGYLLHAKWMRSVRMKECRFYIQGQNIATITKYKGYDPETNFNREGLPPLKIFTAGIHVGF